MLKLGATGQNVIALQRALNHLGANPILVVDGDFGPATQDGVIAFQEAHDLVPDGVVGPLTESSLEAALSQMVSPEPITSTINNTPPSGGGPTNGIDIYPITDDIVDSWAEILAAGYFYVWMKSSDGANARSGILSYWPEAKAAGALVGAYHFYEPSVAPTTQVKIFLAQLQAVGWAAGIDLPPVLDFEAFSNSNGPTDEDYANANVFLMALQSALKVKVIIYASDSVIQGAPSWISSEIVWDARYGSQPKYPNWTFFQNSGSASVPGLNGGSAGSDTDVFQGSLDQLKVWVAATVISS